MVGLPDGEKNYEDVLTFLAQYRRVTVGQTYILPRHIVRAMHTRHAMKNYDKMLSRFHSIPERYGQTTDRRTEFLYQYRASVC